jgi:hypothetical protein
LLCAYIGAGWIAREKRHLTHSVTARKPRDRRGVAILKVDTQYSRHDREHSRVALITLQQHISRLELNAVGSPDQRFERLVSDPAQSFQRPQCRYCDRVGLAHPLSTVLAAHLPTQSRVQASKTLPLLR